LYCINISTHLFVILFFIHACQLFSFPVLACVPSSLPVSAHIQRVHLEELGIDGKIMLKWMFKEWEGGMNGIVLDQDRDKRWAVVNVVMNLWMS
jgi:hypothetical protein